jgi:hypothetical protein
MKLVAQRQSMRSVFNLSKKYLDYKFSPSKAVSCRIVERPGLWMDDCELQIFIAGIKEIARSSTKGELNYGVLGGRREHLDNVVITMLWDKSSGTPIAFNCLSYMTMDFGNRQVEVLHLGLVMVDPNHRTSGLNWVLYGLTSMLLFFRAGLSPIWVSNVTQVPAIFGKVSEAYDTVFPAPVAGSRKTFVHHIIATEMLSKYRHFFGVGPEANFDADRFVIMNSYTGGSEGLLKTFAEAPKHRKQIYGYIRDSQTQSG